MSWFASRYVNLGLAKFFDAFNWTFDRTIRGYGWSVSFLIRISLIA